MRIKIILSLAVISLAFLLCDIKKPCCTILVTTSYGGCGVSGQPLSSGTFTEKFLINEDDCFYEDFLGHWLLNSKGRKENNMIARIEKIDANEVEVVIDEDKKKIKYGKELKVSSTFIFYDGINYHHSICFNN